MTTATSKAAAGAIATVAATLHRDGRRATYSRTEDGALRFIASNQPATIMEIGRHLGVNSSTISPALKRMERKGLVGKSANPNDRRSLLVYLKENGAFALQNDPLYSLANRLQTTFEADDVTLINRSVEILGAGASKWGGGNCLCCPENAPLSITEKKQRSTQTSDLIPQRRPMPGWNQHATLPHPDATKAVTSLARIAPCIVRAGSTEKMSRRQWDALRFYSVVHRQPATVGAYANHQLLGYPAAAHSVNELLARGYLKLMPKKARANRYTISPGGRLMMHRDPNGSIAAVLAEAFIPKDLHRVTSVMYKILRAIAQDS